MTDQEWIEPGGCAPPVAIKRQPPKPASPTLFDLAVRLTPNPALTVHGTLEIILDAIEKIDNEALARALACINARRSGLDAGELTDEQWKAGGINEKLVLINAASALKEALRLMAK